MFALAGFNRNLVALVIGLGSFLVIGTVIAAVVQYKPYGVPDARRDEYEQILDRINTNKLRKAEALKHGGARVHLPEEVHDFGIVDPGAISLEHEFVIENHGTTDLLLERSGSSCKCTVAELEEPVIAPGSSGKVKVIWNAGSELLEEFEQEAWLKTNDPNRDAIILKVSGKIAAPWGVDGLMYAKEQSLRGDPMTASVTLYSQVYDSMLLVETVASSPRVTTSTGPVSSDDLELLRAKSGMRLHATYTPSDTRSSFEETVKVHLADPESGESKWLEVPFSGRFKSSVTFFGPELWKNSGLDLGLVEIGSEKTWSFGVRFRAEDEVKEIFVKGVEPSSLTASVQTIQSVPGTFRVTVRLADDAEPVRFVGDSKHGYVEVASQEDPDLVGWIPLFGQIIDEIQ